jgi:hypothetical protein
MYQGHGYSEGFCAHMEEVIDRIRTTQEEICPVASPDEVCSCCPNLRPEGRCDHEERTAAKDQMLLNAFGLTDHQVYERKALKEQVLSEMTEELFERSCGKCQWHEQGLCSYKLWKENFTEYF